MEERRIDPNSLTERELLILVNSRLAQVENKLSVWEKDQVNVVLRVSQIETKMRLWSVLIGAASGILINILIEILK